MSAKFFTFNGQKNCLHLNEQDRRYLVFTDEQRDAWEQATNGQRLRIIATKKAKGEFIPVPVVQK